MYFWTYQELQTQYGKLTQLPELFVILHEESKMIKIRTLTRLLGFHQLSYCLLFAPGDNPGSPFACLHGVLSPRSLFQSVAVPQSLPVFPDLDTFDEYWSVILLNVSQTGFVFVSHGEVTHF